MHETQPQPQDTLNHTCAHTHGKENTNIDKQTETYLSHMGKHDLCYGSAIDVDVAINFEPTGLQHRKHTLHITVDW